MDLQKPAGKVASIAVDDTIVVSDGEADRIHHVKSYTSTQKNIETGVLGVVLECAAVDVIFNSSGLLLDP